MEQQQLIKKHFKLSFEVHWELVLSKQQLKFATVNREKNVLNWNLSQNLFEPN